MEIKKVMRYIEPCPGKTKMVIKKFVEANYLCGILLKVFHRLMSKPRPSSAASFRTFPLS